MNDATGRDYGFRRRVCHRANTNAAAATTITMRTVSRPGIEPTGDGGPPRCFARTEVDALADSYPVEDALEVIRNVVSAPTDAVRDAVWLTHENKDRLIEAIRKSTGL